MNRVECFNASLRRGDFYIVELTGPFMQQRMMAAFLTLSMLLVSASGCLGLLQSREYMEHLRGDVKLDTATETTVIEHAFTNAEINSEWNEQFIVDEEVTKIGVYFKTEMAGEIIREIFPDVFDFREVTVEIRNPDGSLQYNATHDTTKTAPYFLIEPEVGGKFLSGEWDIFITGTGGGIITEQDNFLLSVDVTRTCTIYPQDDICVVD